MMWAWTLALLALEGVPDLSFGTIFDFLTKAGLLGAAILFIYMLLNDIIYTRGRYNDIVAIYKQRIADLEVERDGMRQDRDDWRVVAKGKVGVVDDAVQLARSRTARRSTDGS
jgi:hypothetical protein